jgi:hypothetical protein
VTTTTSLPRAAVVAVADIEPGDYLFVNRAWRPIARVHEAGAVRLFDVPGAHTVRRDRQAGMFARRHTPQPAPAPELPEPTNAVVVPVAEFKRAMTRRFPLAGHEPLHHPGGPRLASGRTERTVERTSGSHLYLRGPVRGIGIPWPKRGQVKRADGGIFLTCTAEAPARAPTSCS